jgi:TRAP-type mannitol/chloroaromatic compound transport system substrate-binding protein
MEEMRAKTAAISLAALVVLAAPVQAPADPVRLVTPIAYGTHLPGLGEPAMRLAKLIKQLSGGSLELDLKQPGDGTQPQEILDKVASGRVDAGMSTASFWAARLPAAVLFAGFPFGPDAKGYVDWFVAGNGAKLYQEMYDQAGLRVHVIPCAFGGGEAGGWFAKEIHSKADLQGLRMRIFGPGAQVMARLGVSTMLVPGGNVPASFEKHEIDAAELLTPVVDQRQGLQDKVKLIYVPGWHQPETVLELLINKDRWSALDDGQQGIIETACKAMLLMTLAESPRLEADALADLVSKSGVRVEPWPEDVMDALRGSWEAVAKEEGDRDAFFQAVFDDLARFRAKGTSSPQATAASP